MRNRKELLDTSPFPRLEAIEPSVKEIVFIYKECKTPVGNIDLVAFHKGLYTIVELKINKATAYHIGQLLRYFNFLDFHLKHYPRKTGLEGI